MEITAGLATLALAVVRHVASVAPATVVADRVPGYVLLTLAVIVAAVLAWKLSGGNES